MNLSFIEKIGIILKYFTSSFLSIEIFLIVFSLFLFVFLNIKYNDKRVKILIPTILVGILFIIFVYYNSFAIKCFDSFIKSLMYYYYFPNIALYYVIVLFITILFIYTLLNKKIDNKKKIFNYIFFSLVYLMFLELIGYVSINNITLVLGNGLYKNDVILSLIQISNLITLIWIIVTIFYYLYNYFKKKFD